ncbi:hypothetical protein [Diaphorobacter sp.]|uniref:hypothetical protein n=1 Tax=Diaphorobacter sp. TaxID=1934310 RepID=UPI003D117261
MQLFAFQQAMHPAALRHPRASPQEDALALHTLAGHHIWQTPLGQWTCDAPGGFAWLSVADGVASSPCADLASRSFLQVLHRSSPAMPLQAQQLPGLVRQARLDWRAHYHPWRGLHAGQPDICRRAGVRRQQRRCAHLALARAA